MSTAGRTTMWGCGFVGWAALCGALSGCYSPGMFVWYTELPSSDAVRSEYLINTGDVINVRVLGHEEMTVKQRVRTDGRVALAMIGEIEARGKRPSALRAELEGRLKDYIVSPSVTVNVDEVQPMTVVLLGEVARPGAYPVEPNVGLAHALSLGGGLTDYATHDRVFLVRQQPAPTRIRFSYEAISHDDNHAASFPLHPGDMIVVE